MQVDRLREAMRARGMSAYRLAILSGVSESYLSRLLSGERGGRTSAERLAALAGALRVRVGYLLGDSGPMEEAGAARLCDRAEWPSVVATVRERHPELDEAHLAAVGAVPDGAAFVGELDAALVHQLAAALRDWRVRIARQTKT